MSFDPAKPLDAKVVFITGVARGQGRMHARRFAEVGASVIGLDICDQVPSVGYPMSTEADLQDTVRTVEQAGGRIFAARADVRDASGIRKVLNEGLARFGRLDFVIANAGIAPLYDSGSRGLQAWHDCLDIMLTGVMLTVEASYPRLVSQGTGGSIVLTGSMGGLLPMIRSEHSHTFGMLGYSAAKAGVDILAKNYASLLAQHSIRVNVVHPSGVDTDMVRNPMFESHWSTAGPNDGPVLRHALPVDRLQPEDVSALALWLCTDAARYFTGNTLRLDAGASLR